MKCVRSGLAAGLLAVVFGPAKAEVASALTPVAKESPVACVDATKAGKLPKYPENARLQGVGAVVRVRLQFDRADASPSVEVFFNSGDDEFADAVRNFIRAYRLPCLRPGAAPVFAMQEFQFLPARKIIYGGVRDDASKLAALKCLTGNESPFFPTGTRYEGRAGTVLVEVTFVAPQEPPQVKVVFGGSRGIFNSTVLETVSHYRLPCLTPSDAPVTAQQIFRFRREGSSAYSLKDLTLREFLGAVDKIDQQHVRFDFTTMGCPFEVQLTPLQPYAQNMVGEVERSDPGRREFLEWLSGLSLRLFGQARDDTIGDSMKISVPCLVLDLS